MDFNETYASTVKTSSVRLLLALAAYFNLDLTVIDIVTFFLYGILKEKLHMEQPAGYEEMGRDYVCELKKSLYGTKQAPRCANETLVTALLKLDFIQLASDDSVFILKKGKSVVIMGVHVDDGLIVSNDKNLLNGALGSLEKTFKLKRNDNPDIYVGIQIERNRKEGWLKIHQEAAVLKLLTELKMDDCKPVPTPMVPGADLPVNLVVDDSTGHMLRC